MENVSSSNGLEKCPKLRFPGFTEPWRITQLCNLFKKNTQKNSSGAVTNVISNSAKNGLIPQKDYFDKDIANADNTAGYYIIRKNDFVYNPRKSSDAPYGPISRYTYDDDGIVSPLYLCFRSKDVNPEYFEKYFRSTAWHRYIYMSGDNGARHDRVSIKDETFFEMPVHLPCNKEQEKIATFLSLLEQKIELQRVLVDNLKKYKRGVIRKIFAQEIRFVPKDGSAFPAWKEYSLENVVEFLDGQRKPLECAERATMKGEYPYYGASGIIDYINNYIFNEPLLLLGEDGANIITRSSPLCFIATGKYWVNNHAHVMRPKQGFDLQFVCEALESIDYTKYNTGTAQPKLNQEKCRKITFNYPCYDEQIIISKFISELNKRIHETEKQLSLFETQKRTLLQQLFI